MDYLRLDSSRGRLLIRWRYLALACAGFIVILSIELYYLLLRLSDLDPVHLALGICQATTLLIFQIIQATAMIKDLKTCLLGVTIISLVFNIGYLVFYCLLELSTVFQVYQGNMSLQPAHPRWWYEIQQTFTTSLVVQEILAILNCAICFKVKTLIPDISEPDIIPGNSVCETVVHGVLTEAGTPKGKASKNILYVENGILYVIPSLTLILCYKDDVVATQVYAYTTVKKNDSYSEDSFGKHQATSYMQNATQIRGVKAKLDDTIDENILGTSPLDTESPVTKDLVETK